MKKLLFTIIVFMSMLLTNVKAQIDITDNYSRLYASYINMGLSESSLSKHGAMAGYTYGINVGYTPLFVELGAEYLWVTGDDENIHMANIPLSLAYKLGNDYVNIAPTAGVDAHFNIAYFYDGESYSDYLTVFQGGWHAGATINIGNFSIGYKYTRSFNDFFKDSDAISFTHSAFIGVCF